MLSIRYRKKHGLTGEHLFSISIMGICDRSLWWGLSFCDLSESSAVDNVVVVCAEPSEDAANAEGDNHIGKGVCHFCCTSLIKSRASIALSML